MTAREFQDNINNWWELQEFCRDAECDIMDDVMDEEGMDETIESNLAEDISYNTWREISRWLSDIPTGYDYYRNNGDYEFIPLDADDFASYKNDVYAWALNTGIFDDTEEDAVEEEIEEDDFLTDEDFAVSDLIDMCSATLVVIQEDVDRITAERERDFAQFIDANIPRVIK